MTQPKSVTRLGDFWQQFLLTLAGQIFGDSLAIYKHVNFE